MRCTFFQGDYTGLTENADFEADIIVTSPPYNIGTKYDQYDDTMSEQTYLNYIDQFGWEMSVIAHEGTSLFLNIGGKPSNPMLPLKVATVLTEDYGWTLQNTIHWIKSIAVPSEDGLKTIGHYKPINSPRYLNDCHEYIFHLTQGGETPIDRLKIGVPYSDKSNMNRWAAAEQDVHCAGNNWYIPYNTVKAAKDHPASFPVELPKRCIQLASLGRKDLIVVDPFMGIGTTAVAALELGHRFYGSDLSLAYIEKASERVEHLVKGDELEIIWN